MTKAGKSNHQKRVSSPKTWPIDRKKINSRLVKVDQSKRVKNYVYRLISEKRYKKLVNLKEIYKFSDIE